MLRRNVRSCSPWIAVACVLVSAPFASAQEPAFVLTGSSWPPWEAARAMDELGQLNNVRYEFRDYTDSVTLFKAKRVDAALMNLYEYLILCRDQQLAEDTSIILVTNHSEGGDMVVARPEIVRPYDLKGRNVGLQLDTLSLYVLHMTLRKDGLTLADVNLKGVKAEQIAKAFERSQSLAAVVGWNPCATSAVEKGGRKLATTADFPGAIVDIMVVWDESLQGSRDAYVQFLKGWFAARQDPKALAKAAELNGVSVKEFSEWLKDAKTFDTPQTALGALRKINDAIGRIDDFLLANRDNVPDTIRDMFGKRTKQGNLVDASLLEELVSE